MTIGNTSADIGNKFQNKYLTAQLLLWQYPLIPGLFFCECSRKGAERSLSTVFKIPLNLSEVL